MRSIGELMKDMGFNQDAPLETQKAFIRHLIKAANETDQTRNQIQKQSIPAAPLEIAYPSSPGETQLSFDPNILGTQSKKSATR
jgi:hypothetical protein